MSRMKDFLLDQFADSIDVSHDEPGYVQIEVETRGDQLLVIIDLQEATQELRIYRKDGTLLADQIEL